MFIGVIIQQAAGEDELQLDEEMERVVWGDTPARFPANSAAEPRRDDAAPPPYSQTLGKENLPLTDIIATWGHRSSPQRPR